MTSTTAPTAHATSDYPRAAAIAVGGAALLVLRLLLEGRNQIWSDVIAVAVFGAVALVVAFGLLVPRALRASPAAASWTAVVLALLGVAGLVLFFFAPVPFVFGYAAWFLARTPLARAAQSGRTRVAEVLGIVAMVLNVAYAVYGVIHGWGPGLPH